MKRRSSFIAVVVLAVALVGGTLGVVAPAGAASKKEFRVGLLVDATGPASTTFAQFTKITDAWAKHVNATKALGAGVKVKLFTVDGGSNPATELTGARQLVEQDKVTVLIPAISNLSSISSYVTERKIPAIGGIVQDTAYVTVPFVFGPAPTTDNLALGIISLGAKAGYKTGGVVYCAEVPACATTLPIVRQAFTDAGVKYAFESAISATQPSYTSECLKAKDAGVQVMQLNTPGPTAIRFVQACATQGYKPQFVMSSGPYTTDMLKVPELDGLKIAMNNLPYVADSPAIKEMNKALDKYAPGLRTSTDFNQNGVTAWAAGKLIEAAVLKAKGKTTSAGVLAGLLKLKNETLGGLAPPLNYDMSGKRSIKCVFDASIKGGQLTAPSLEPVC